MDHSRDSIKYYESRETILRKQDDAAKPKEPYDPYYSHLLSALAHSHQEMASREMQRGDNNSYAFLMGMARAFETSLAHYNSLNSNGYLVPPAIELGNTY